MDSPLNQMSAIVFTLLQSSKDMFPANYKCTKSLQSCYGDGYKALMMIMLDVHPAFHTYPSTLVKAYPTQENLTLHQYYGRFTNYQQLRAYVSDITLSLDDKSELDIFLDNAKYGAFLHQCVHANRADHTLWHQPATWQVLYSVCHACPWVPSGTTIFFSAQISRTCPC
jgi:hypothetical protein